MEVNGGAELLCRLIAEHLSKYFEVEVITTCAIDYVTWKDEYSPGKSEVNGITVLRFPVDFQRDPIKFDEFYGKLLNGTLQGREEEIQWMKLQGPYSTKLLDYIANNKDNYDYFIFITYLYCTTYFGLPLVSDKAILVPTAHDEPPIYLSIFESIFQKPQAIIFSTEEEKNFVHSKFGNSTIPNYIIGVGVDTPVKINPEEFKHKYNVDDFVLYAGRIDESKGCKELFEFFIRYKQETGSKIKLVLLGKAVMEVPKHPDILPLGFVSEEDKFGGMMGANLLIMPSKYESFSFVVMESWLCCNPVLVNGCCDVLKGHAIKSNGGLYYDDYEEFRECLNLLLNEKRLSMIMGRNGKKYAVNNYSWEFVEQKYLNLFNYLEGQI